MTEPSGYPLPSGELGDDDIVCQLVYLPDRPEYWQAFLASYHYFTTWKAWERDDDKRGKDAAANWREAFEETMGCWRMTCLSEIEELLRQINSKTCCASAIFTQQPSGIAPNTGTEIQFQQGTEPDEYGDVAITDWDDWAEYKCEAAHLLVEEVAIKFEQLAGLKADYNDDDVTVEMLGWVLSKLTPLLVFINLAWDVFQAISGIGWELIGDFSAAAAEIRDGVDDIACAIVNADGAKDCAEDFLAACKVEVTSVAGDLLLEAMPWEAWANMIYTGIAITNEGDEVYLTDVMDAPGTHTCCNPTYVEFREAQSHDGYRPFSSVSKLITAPTPDAERVTTWFWEEAAMTTEKNVTITSIETDVAINNDLSGGTYVMWDKDLNLLYDSDVKPTLPYSGVAGIQLIDSRAVNPPTEFEATIDWEDE
jgi:hypothetical protein